MLINNLKALAFILCLWVTPARIFALQGNADKEMKIEQFRNKIRRVVVIFQENWSFNGRSGKPLMTLPQLVPPSSFRHTKKKNHIEHAQYETVSILKFIETRMF